MIHNIIKNGNYFEGKIKLSEWEKYWNEELDLKLNIGGDCETNDIKKFHENGYKYLLSEQLSILEKIICEIYSNYREWQKEYDYDEKEKKLFMPDIKEKDELKLLIKPRRVYLMNIEKRNISYIGFEFACSWDEEHGLGIMTYKNDIVAVGGAEFSFMSWVAEEDLKG